MRMSLTDNEQAMLGILELLKSVKDNIDDLLNFSPSSVKGSYADHRIEVFFDAKFLRLYVDGKIVDESKVYFSPRRDVALLRHTIENQGELHHIEMFGTSSLFSLPRVKICVDGNKISGDDF